MKISYIQTCTMSISWVLGLSIEYILNTQTQTQILKKFDTQTHNSNSNTQKIFEFSLFFKFFCIFRKLNSSDNRASSDNRVKCWLSELSVLFGFPCYSIFLSLRTCCDFLEIALRPHYNLMRSQWEFDMEITAK